MYYIVVYLLIKNSDKWYCGEVLGRLAQLVEQLIYTHQVAGSSPASPTKTIFLTNTQVAP